MAKRNFRRAADDPFNEEEATASNSWLETSSQIFGDIAAADAMVERIRSISIFDIIPDSAQPRRTIPTVVRQTWDGAATGIAEMFKVWWGAVEEERGLPFDLGAYLESEETERSKESSFSHTPGPLENAFTTVISLAASIRRDGLTNPVTVAPAGGQYRLETGERRWLAYHLLYAWFDGHDDRPDEQETWGKIPAREVKQVSVWRQANENNARADLNAIGKARQWAVLMMDLHEQASFKPLSAFSSEREFYAQAHDKRPPYGKGEQLLNAMGVTSRSALARYRALLKLPDEIWQGGDDLNLPEEQLYNLARLPHDEAIKRYRQIVLGRNNVEEALTAREDDEVYAPGTKRHFTRLARVVVRAGRGKHKYNAQALKSLGELREWIDQQEERIRKLLD